MNLMLRVIVPLVIFALVCSLAALALLFAWQEYLGPSTHHVIITNGRPGDSAHLLAVFIASGILVAIVVLLFLAALVWGITRWRKERRIVAKHQAKGKGAGCIVVDLAERRLQQRLRK